MSIGLEDVASRKKINLTLLRRNTRTRSEKRIGRKAPRPGDYEIFPAPDARVFVKIYNYNNYYAQSFVHSYNYCIIIV